MVTGLMNPALLNQGFGALFIRARLGKTTTQIQGKGKLPI